MKPPVDDAELSDETLLRRMAQRDEAALGVLYDRHAQVIYNLIFRIVRDAMVADEILQETFFQAWSKADTFRGGGAAGGWLYRIARNQSLDALRRRKSGPQTHQTQSDAEEQALWSTLGSESDVDQAMEGHWTRTQVKRALDLIPEEQRLCLELAYFEGMSQSQIAEHTTVPLGTIKTRIRMGMQKLERILRSAGM